MSALIAPLQTPAGLLPWGSHGKLHALVTIDTIKTDDGPRFIRRYASGEFKTSDGTRYKAHSSGVRRLTKKPAPKWERAKAGRAVA